MEILEKHPDLAGKLADANLLTPESTRYKHTIEDKVSACIEDKVSACVEDKV